MRILDHTFSFFSFFRNILSLRSKEKGRYTYAGGGGGSWTYTMLIIIKSNLKWCYGYKTNIECFALALLVPGIACAKEKNLKKEPSGDKREFK